MTKDHIYHEGKTKIDENTKFLFYANIVGQGGCGGHGYGIFKIWIQIFNIQKMENSKIL